MDQQLINILAGGGIAAFTSILTLLIQRYFEARRRREDWEHERQKALEDEARARRKAEEDKTATRGATFERYRYPLFRAGFDLQSRLYNLVKGSGRDLFLSAEHAPYMVDSTLYLLSNFFASLEIVRHQGDAFQFPQPAQSEAFNRLTAEIETEFNRRDTNNPLTVFRLRQRELGELLIVEAPQGEKCLSYSRFTALLNDSAQSEGTLQDLRARIRLIGNLSGDLAALRRIQNLLVDLLDLLDPPSPTQAYAGLRGKA